MEWISVDDKLPEIDGQYSDRILFYGKNGNRGIDVREPHFGIYSKIGTWFSHGDIIKDVTHWAKIEPPE